VSAPTTTLSVLLTSSFLSKRKRNEFFQPLSVSPTSRVREFHQGEFRSVRNRPRDGRYGGVEYTGRTRSSQMWQHRRTRWKGKSGWNYGTPNYRYTVSNNRNQFSGSTQHSISIITLVTHLLVSTPNTATVGTGMCLCDGNGGNACGLRLQWNTDVWLYTRLLTATRTMAMLAAHADRREEERGGSCT
jgi:hypothetical protein